MSYYKKIFKNKIRVAGSKGEKPSFLMPPSSAFAKQGFQIYEALDLICEGPVAGLVDAFPEETVAIYTYCKLGQWEKARKVFRWFLPLLELDISPQLVQNIKLCEVATGLGTGYVRPPRLSLTGKVNEAVENIIKKALKTRPQNLDYKKYI